MKRIILLLTIIFSVKSYSQDPAFTQSFMVPESINPSFKKNGKYGVNLCNGVLSNQTVQGVKHISNNSSNKDKDQYDTISSIPPTVLASRQHQFIINSNRQDSKNSITLNHRYREDDGGHGTELRVYRYDGWRSGLSHTSCNGTKSTLV